MNLGLCCIWLDSKPSPETSFQALTVKRFKELGADGISVLSRKILHNTSVMQKIIRNCHANNIRGYRMSSGFWCCLIAPDVNLTFGDLPDSAEILQNLKLCGEIAQLLNVRLSFHPSEFITLAGDNTQAIENSIKELNLHGEVMDICGLPQTHYHPINIHIRKEGCPRKLSCQFLSNFDRLAENCRARLVLENNDNKNGTWGVENLFEYFTVPHGIPVTFDVLHHCFLDQGLTERQAAQLAFHSWGDIRPLFHFSCSADGTRKHADFANAPIPDLGFDVDWDVELKMKNLAIKKLLA